MTNFLFEYRKWIFARAPALLLVGLALLLSNHTKYAGAIGLSGIVYYGLWNLLGAIMRVRRAPRVAEGAIHRFRVDNDLPPDNNDYFDDGVDWRGYHVTSWFHSSTATSIELEPLRECRVDFRMRSHRGHKRLREGSGHAVPFPLETMRGGTPEFDAFFIECSAAPGVADHWNPTDAERAVLEGADASSWGPFIQKVFEHPFMLSGARYHPTRRFGDSGPPAYSFRVLRHRGWSFHISLSPAAVGIFVYPGVSEAMMLEMLPMLADVGDAIHACIERAGNGGNDPIDLGGCRLFWSDRTIDIDWPRSMPSQLLLASQREHESMDEVLAAAWVRHRRRNDDTTRESVVAEARRDISKLQTFETGDPLLDALLPMRGIVPKYLHWAATEVELDTIRSFVSRYVDGASPIASYLAISSRGVHITLRDRFAKSIIESDLAALTSFSKTTHAVLVRLMDAEDVASG